MDIHQYQVKRLDWQVLLNGFKCELAVVTKRRLVTHAVEQNPHEFLIDQVVFGDEYSDQPVGGWMV